MRRKFVLIGTILPIFLALTSSAFGTAFVGSYNPTFYYAFNIGDGVIIGEETGSLVITEGSGPNELDFVENTALGLVSGTIIQSGNIAIFPTRHYDLGYAYMSDYFVMSDGNNMGSVHIRQEKDDPSNISFNVSVWQRNPSSATIDDLIGTWHLGPHYGHPNLLDIANGPEFDDLGYWSISKETENSVVLRSKEDPNHYIGLQVTGNFAYLDSPFATNFGYHHEFGILFDKSGFSLFGVTSELDDPYDVSVGIVLGTPVPEAATMLLLGSGLLGLAGFRKKFRKG